MSVEIFPGFTVSGIGTIPLAELETRSGLETLQRLIDGILPAPPINQRLNFALAEIAPGRAVFRGLPGARHLNPLGGVHGGWTATIMDSAMACAVHSLIDPGEAYTTAEFKVNLIRPVGTQTGEVRCEGTIVHRGRTTAVSEGRLFDSGGRLLAFGTETCSIFPLAQLTGRQG